ncbi:MAG: site-specific integrase [Brasilonema angustatum HA4187-MV1]|jgi:integrase/recombinase XerD|nr:site-specific integrase [Brasilonema angustatum HA4187-MV1]
MKVKGNGQAKVLTHGEMIQFFQALKTPRDRCLFAICLFTGCRVSEALQLQTSDIKGNTIVFRKSSTKGKLKTREMAIHPQLLPFFDEYQVLKDGALFPPGNNGAKKKHLNRVTADKIFRDACADAKIQGASTHSFRRTALTQMSKSNIPLRTIQQISGHSDLGTLQRYLEVSPEEITAAIGHIQL